MDGTVAVAGAVYTRYAELMQNQPEGLGGSLLMTCLPAEPAASAAGTIAMRAVNIAGAATLLVTHDGEVARALVRSGVCDILVTTLDEALRVLKNEVRRRRQVAVVLPGDAVTVARECVVRGLQPQLLLGVAEPTLVARGASVIPVEGGLPASTEMVWWTATSGAAILDRLAVESLGRQGRSARLRWLARAPQYLGRELARVRTLPLSDDETMRFCDAVRGELAAGRVAGGVSVWRGGVELVGDRAEQPETQISATE